MKKPASLLKLRPHFAQKGAAIQHSGYSDDSGFTLIELLVVILIIGVISAIAAPGWMSFVTQRRMNAANEVVFRSLQEAQNLAKSTKRSYSVSFRNNNNVPEIAIYQTQTTQSDGSSLTIDPVTALTAKAWKNLGEEIGLEPGQVVLGTNLNSENKAGSFSYQVDPKQQKITFDYLGTLSTTGATTGLTISVASGRGNNPSEAMMRCVKVTTLLGALKTGKGPSECKS